MMKAIIGPRSALLWLGCTLSVTVVVVQGFVGVPVAPGRQFATRTRVSAEASSSSSSAQQDAVYDDKSNTHNLQDSSRRTFLTSIPAVAAAVTTTGFFSTSSSPSSFLGVQPAWAMGPVKVALEPISYIARPCPPNRPIPGEKAMFGMRGLCVTVTAKVKEAPPKDLEKVGVYGFVTDADSGDSVLANNPDLSTDAGQFAMIESITPKTQQVTFEFVAAVPNEKDVSRYENGIGPLSFVGLKAISFPGGQQYGDINPCEMNEFSDECEAWEAENGPYQKAEYMMKSNPRTKGY